MAKKKTKRKVSARVDKQAWRRAEKDMPVVIHRNHSQVPRELLKDFRRANYWLLTHKSRLPAGVIERIRGGTVNEHMEASIEFVSEIIRRMDDSVVAAYLPPYGLRMTMKAPWNVECRWFKLIERPSPSGKKGGTILYHPGRHRIDINGGKYIPAFTHHALERLIDRLYVKSQYNRVLVTNILRVNANACRYEPVGNDGYWLWAVVRDGEVASKIEQLVHGGEPSHCYYLRVGYFPVAYDGVFAVAKTMLSPAMKVPGIAAELCSFRKLAEGSPAAFNEFRKLHEKLPLVKTFIRRVY